MPSNKITVLFFGQIAEQTGVRSAELQDQADTDTAVRAIMLRYPRLGQTPYQVALDLEIVHGNQALERDHTMAFLPPYAGG